MAKITYDDKVALITNPDIPDVNKVKSDDMNEIKSVVNENDDKFLTNGVNIGTSVDSSYRTNILHSKNLFDKDNANEQSLYWSSNKLLTDSGATSKSIYIPVKPNTTYTISKNVGKTFRIATTNSIPANNVSTISSQANHTGTSITITTESNANYLWVNYFNTQNGDTGSSSDMLASLQIEIGNEATTYEPYITPSIVVDNEEIYSKPVVLFEYCPPLH